MTALRILGNKSDAEDVVQDFFLAVYLRRLRYDPARGSVKTWLSRFAQYRALEAKRTTPAAASRFIVVECFDESESGEIGPKQDSAIGDHHVLIEECLITLPPVQRKTIEAIHFEGYTFAEAAVILEQSLPTTRNHYYRGMESLRKFVKDRGSVRKNLVYDLDQRQSNIRDRALALETGS